MPLTQEMINETMKPLGGSQWKPIETAPKYKNVLVWRDDAGEPWIARFDSNCHFIQNDDACDPDYEAWISEAWGFHEGVEAPTHWMPLRMVRRQMID